MKRTHHLHQNIKWLTNKLYFLVIELSEIKNIYFWLQLMYT